MADVTQRRIIRVSGSPLERFRARVHVSETGCWIWTGTINEPGYGQFWNGAKVVYVHRWAYEYFVGPIPTGRPHLDHLCRTTACCNPTHLEPVTQRENNRRTRLTGCRRGHSYPEHEYRAPNGRRCCRQCRRERDADRHNREAGGRIRCSRCGRQVGRNPRAVVPTPVAHKRLNGMWCSGEEETNG